jgi:hypothetical protein
MENKTIEQIQNEVLELTQKIESVKNNLTELQNKESQKSKIDFETFMDWAECYFERKDNSRSIGNDLSSELDIDDYCRVNLSIDYGNEIQIEKEWTDTNDIVEKVFDLALEDFKNFMIQELENQIEKEIENNL